MGFWVGNKSMGDTLAWGIIILCAISLASGALIMWLIPKLWDFIKPWLHSVTA